MTTDLERDSASYDRLRRWLSRPLEGDSVDRLLIRHDTGAEVATMRGDEGGPFECADGPVDELASSIAERVFEDAIGLGGVQRYIVIAYGLDSDRRHAARTPTPGADRLPGDPSTASPRPARAGFANDTPLEIGAPTPPWSRTSSRCVADAARRTNGSPSEGAPGDGAPPNGSSATTIGAARKPRGRSKGRGHARGAGHLCNSRRRRSTARRQGSGCRRRLRQRVGPGAGGGTLKAEQLEA